MEQIERKLGDFLYESALSFLKTFGQNLDVLTVKQEAWYAFNGAIDDYVRDHYHIVYFDSPMGKDSSELLKKVGLQCEWTGHTGERGVTKVYLPVDKYPEAYNLGYDFKKTIQTISKLNESYKNLEEIFDCQSRISIGLANKKQ